MPILRVSFILVALLLSARGFTQRTSFAFNRISTDDGIGLMTNRIYSLYQDEKGFIWLGTASGLQRFDGGNFVRFDPTGTKGHPLPTVAIEQILPAGRGKFWIAAKTIRQFGIFDFSTFSFQVVPLETSKPIPPRSEFNLWQDSLRQTFLTIQRYGKVLVYDSLRKVFTEKTPLNQVPRGWNILKNIFYDHPKQQYWITCDSGIAIYDLRSKQMWSRWHNPRRIPQLEDDIYRNGTVSDIYIDKERRHWIFYWTGRQYFQCFDSLYRPLVNDTLGLNNVNTSYAELQHFKVTSSGTLWIYGLANLYAREKNQSRFTLFRNEFIDNYGIRYQSVYDLLEDRDGLLWIATDEGLYYTNTAETRVANIFLSTIPGHYEVTDLAELRNGHYWVSTWGRGVITLDSAFRPYPSPLYRSMPRMDTVTRVAYNQVWAICEDSLSGKIYLGCQRGQLMIHQPSTGTTSYLHPEVFDQRTIRYITTDAKGRVWFGTQGGRVVRYDGKDFTIMADFGSGAIVYKVFIDNEGWVWCATLDLGLIALEPETGAKKMHLQSGNTPQSLFGATCDDIEQLNDSLILVANAALSIVNKRTGKVQNLTVFDGLPSNSVKKIRLDRRGYLWLITENGLCRYDHSRRLFTTYGKKDGILLANKTNKADYLCRDDRVMFAGTNSLLFFHPDAFRNTSPPPDVTITDFLLGENYQPVDSLLRLPEIRLGANENFFVVSFASIDFRNRDKFIYYYRLDGLHDAWIRSENLNLVFTGLPPGRYTLRIKAENLEGQVSRHETQLRLRILPPFWRAPWFLTLLLLALAALGRYIYLLQVRRIRERSIIRNRIARDLHDDMGSTLSIINILSAMARTKLPEDPERTAEYLGKISDNSQRMMEAMDDIVWAIKPDNDTMQKVVARMRECATQVLEARNVDIVFTQDEEVLQVKLNMEQRRDFFLFFKEAVNNIAKYAQATQAKISLGVQQRTLMLDVADDGIGFDVEAADSGNGLGNMRKRADALNGRCRIDSAPGKGTRISLEVPLS